MSGDDADVDRSESGGARGSMHISSENIDEMREDSVGGDDGPTNVKESLKALGYKMGYNTGGEGKRAGDARGSGSSIFGYSLSEIAAMLLVILVLLFVLVSMLEFVLRLLF